MKKPLGSLPERALKVMVTPAAMPFRRYVSFWTGSVRAFASASARGSS